MDLIFSAQGQSWPVKLNDKAERTQKALLAALPMQLQLHTPKIAGSHIYWHAPFVEDVEGAVHVLDAKPGAFIYWPVRQFLEITFAPLQAETAHITVLGHLDAPIEGIAALAQSLKIEQGQKVFNATLQRTDSAAASAEISSDITDDIVQARIALWKSCPLEIIRLTESRAIMHPAGPVFAAESEARVLHELLWWVRAEIGRADQSTQRKTAALVINKAATRLRDFCHLDETSAILFRLERAMQEDLPFNQLIDEAILIAGRIGAWLDLLIPWNDINEAFRLAASQRDVTHG